MSEQINANADGYVNAITGVGTRRDPTTSTEYRPDPILGQLELESIFTGDGVGRRIVEMPAEDMLEPWLTVECEDEVAIGDALEVIGAQERTTEAAVWGRLYGGALVVFLLDDGGTLSTPLNINNIRRFVGMKVYDRFAVSLNPTTYPASDELRRLYNLPEMFDVTPANGGMQFQVHESRCYMVPGKRIPDRVKLMNGGWDHPVLQGAYAALQRYGTSQGYTANILKDFVLSILAVKDLTALLAAGKDDVVQRRLRLLDMSRSILNSLVIDADGETMTKSASSVAGLADILDRFAEHLSTSVSIPVAKLFGRAPGGLNSTGDFDNDSYNKMLGSERARTVTGLLERMIKLIFLAKDGPTGGKEPDAWSIRWNDFNPISEEKEAAIRKTVAETDDIYIGNGVLVAEEVAQSRFGSGAWSSDTQLIPGTERGLDDTTTEDEPDDPEGTSDTLPGGN